MNLGAPDASTSQYCNLRICSTKSLDVLAPISAPLEIVLTEPCGTVVKLLYCSQNYAHSLVSSLR